MAAPDAPRPDLDEADPLHVLSRGVLLADYDQQAAELDRLRAALALHRPVPRKGYDHLTVCADDGQVWPCRTHVAHEEA